MLRGDLATGLRYLADVPRLLAASEGDSSADSELEHPDLERGR